jgi:hypothetical protein
MRLAFCVVQLAFHVLCSWHSVLCSWHSTCCAAGIPRVVFILKQKAGTDIRQAVTSVLSF